MPLDEIISNVWKSAAFLTAIAALLGIRVSRRNGIKGDEREARKIEQEQKRDTVADRDDFINQLQEEIRGYREEVAGFRNQLSQVLHLYALEQEYSRLLLDWGYRGATPPPPTRPNTAFPS